MKNFWLVSFSLLLGFAGRADDPSFPPVPEGRRLCRIVAERFPQGNVHIGGTTGWRKRAVGDGVVLDREFKYVTPENDFKQRFVYPSPGVWNWKYTDAWVSHCRKTGQLLRLHGPISPQCSRWVKEDDRAPEELKKHLVEFMTALCKRYAAEKHVRWIDVVNETLLPGGSWHGPREGVEKWESPWTKIGFDEDTPLRPPSYIRLAFEVATRHAPNQKLIINQHTGAESASWEKIKELVPWLRGKGLRVDGVGWQAHVGVGWEKKANNLGRLEALIDWAHANKLSFHVTEANVWLKEEKKDFDAQAKTFTAILKVLLKKRNKGVVTWNVWGISDRNSWRSDRRWEGALFDRKHVAKPAYYAIQRLLDKPPDPDR